MDRNRQDQIRVAVAVDSEPRIEQIGERHLVGISLRMSLDQDATPRLWGSFMPRRGEVNGRLSTDVISLRTFDQSPGASPFLPDVEFEKFALVEVEEGATVPDGMVSFTLPAGQYAVFTHRGPASEAHGTFQYIFGRWLPASRFEFEPRPQFEVLREGYNPMDPEAEEEIWVPVRSTRD